MLLVGVGCGADDGGTATVAAGSLVDVSTDTADAVSDVATDASGDAGTDAADILLSVINRLDPPEERIEAMRLLLVKHGYLAADDRLQRG